MKLIKLSDTHYIIVDDSEIKEGDWIGYPNLKEFVPVQYLGGDLTGYEKKITHSTQPLEFHEYNNCYFFNDIKKISLSEVEEAINGYSVEKFCKEKVEKIYSKYIQVDMLEDYITLFILGFKAHQKLVKDKLFTVGDMMNAFVSGTNSGANYQNLVDYDSDNNEDAEEFSKNEFEEFKESLLPKTEWDVEFDEQGKLKLI